MNNSKNLWKTINKIDETSSVKTPTSISNKDNEHSCNTSSKDIANEFNKYFTSIGNELSSINLMIMTMLNVLVIVCVLIKITAQQIISNLV